MASDKAIEARDKSRRKAEERKAAAARGFEFKGFVNLELTVEHKQAFAQWESDDDLVADFIADAVEGVGKLSLSYHGGQGCFLASLTVTNVRRADVGYCVTARSVDLYKALRRVVYLYWQVAAGDLTTVGAGQNQRYSDDVW